MRYPRENGSTFGGVVIVACVVIAYCAGYETRNQGIKFKIDIPHQQIQRGTK